ncbi:hypothetical protein [Halalkalibacter flavus]|uniref:hypothetical protein n=1 Tax=Halalkalibacter flavus TaxID=3090668 RepID=UPI002FC67984
MGKLIDLTGQTFGKWTVLKRVDNRKNHPYWMCLCECGTIREVKGSALRDAVSTSCGCAVIYNDLTGRSFYYWTVIQHKKTCKQSNLLDVPLSMWQRTRNHF